MKTLLVLGASSDIANATARRYASDGYDLILAGRDLEELARTASDIQIRLNVRAWAVHFDARAFSTHESFYESLPAKPDGVLCAIGYLGNQSAAESDLSETQKVIETNFTGCVTILNIVANDFERREAGFMIVLSSVAGDRGRRSNYLYGSSKAGLTAYLSGLRSRLSKVNVQVLTVKPGFVATRMTEGMNLPPLLTAKPEMVARDIVRAQKKGNNAVYTRWFWRWIMLVIRSIPEFVFKKMPL